MFDLTKDIAFEREEVIKWVNEHNNKEVVVVDEAVNVAYNRDFLNKEQKQLNKIMDMTRDRNLGIFLCLPNFKNCDVHIRHRAKIWVYVEKRGCALVFIAPKNPAKSDKWDLKLLENLWSKGKDLSVTFPPFHSTLNFNKLPADVEKVYKKIKDEKRSKIELDELEKQKAKGSCENCGGNSWTFIRTKKLQECRSCGFRRTPNHLLPHTQEEVAYTINNTQEAKIDETDEQID